MTNKSIFIKNALIKLENELTKQRRGVSTKEQYRSQLNVFNNYLFPDEDIADIPETEVKKYLERPENQTKNQALYALQFYYNEVLKKGYDFSSHKISAKKNTNPVFFTKDELRDFLKQADSKYRLLFALMYHFRLRRGEVLSIKKRDITKTANTMAIYLKKTSYPLPISLQTELDNYLSIHKPKKWLFEKNKTEEQLVGETVSHKFTEFLPKAKIHKALSPKSLKNSHIEHSSQIGITLIDEVLGNNSVKRKRVFIGLDRLEELNKIHSNDFDLTKLVRFCEQLNGAYASEWYLTTSMLQRAILDHVPPIFGFNTFTKVANNYKGDRTFKLFAKRLDDTSRKISDKYLHSPIRKTEVFPNPTQIDFKQEFDYILAEIIRILS